MAYLPFLGEEYDWRYCLQSLLQKKFGYWIGTLINGSMRGLWHISMLILSHASNDVFYAGLRQIAFCICLGFFLTFSKEVTNNIWLLAVLHYLNNQFAVFISLNPSSVGKINATGFLDALSIFIYNAIYILPFLVYRLYLWKKAKKAPANYSTRMLGEANKHLAPSYSIHSPELPWIRSRKEARCLADSG